MAIESTPGILIVGSFLPEASGTRRPSEDLAGRLEEINWRVITTSSWRNRYLQLFDLSFALWQKRSQYQVAVIDVFSGLAFIKAEISSLILRMLGKPFILTLHGGNLPAFARRWPMRVSRLLRLASAVTVPSQYLLTAMKPFIENARLLSNPLNVGHYSYLLRDKPRPRLIWLRAFHHIYNPAMAPQVIAKLSSFSPNVRLTMIGPDKGDGSLAAMRGDANNLGVTDKLWIPGAIPHADVRVWLDQNDIFINTSNIDNTPISVMEAMACGLCIVSTNVGGIPYLLTNERDALLVPPNDSDAMAEAVRRVLTEPGLAARLSFNARRKAEQFDWSVILPQWESLLNQVIMAQYSPIWH